VLLSLNQVLERKTDYDLLDHIVSRVQNLVCVDWEHEALPSVNFDRFAAAYQATQHLLGLGHKRIAYIGPCDLRIPGYKTAMAERGLSAHSFRSEGSAETGYESARACQLSHFSAIVAGTDEVAFGVLKYCKDAAIIVPKDMALVSIDNIALSAFAQPSLTTIAVPQKDIGERAVEILIENAQVPSRVSKQIMLAIKLVIRESCGQTLHSSIQPLEN
jgi:DNA-binding LacI/PurR family transcriptional regulator